MTGDLKEAWLFSDEAGIQLDPTLAAQWAPRGKQPQIASESKLGRISLCGVEDARTGDAYVKRIERGNSLNFIGALIWILNQFDRYDKIHLYVDNAVWHKSKRVRNFLEMQSKLELDYFPRYCPELNPTEWEWHELRRLKTHTRRFQSEEECWAVIDEHFSSRKGTSSHFLCQII